jgi:dienelactone hydrolase
VTRAASLLLIAFAAMPAQAADLDAEARGLVAELSQRRFADAARRYDATMAAALPSEKLAQVWDAVLAQAGAFGRVERLRREAHRNLTIVFVTCAFAKGPLDVKVVFDEQARVAGLFFLPPPAPWAPPAYADAKTFEERPLTVGDAPHALEGTMTLPRGAGPFAAVVLVHGSGPMDADETVGAIKMFKDLAWGLATRGVASLRYEKRPRRYPREFAPERAFTVEEEVIADARAALARSAAQPMIDGKRIFLVGHSQGGYLAPRIARGGGWAGFVAMAGNTRPTEELVVEQMRALAPGNAQALAAAVADRDAIRDPRLTPDARVRFAGGMGPGRIGSICAGISRPRWRRRSRCRS